MLEGKGINWEYAKRAKASSLNRRIRRYIPGREVLEKRLRALFDGYKDMQCSTKSGRSQPFFSPEALAMSERLLETARLGFLSDPPGISLYYRMATDRDGLTIYRTIRGTNSVEGGVHMTIRRVFGSLQASPELAECLLLNWILRRNKSVGVSVLIQNSPLRNYRLATRIGPARNSLVTLTNGSMTKLLSWPLSLVSSLPSHSLESLPPVLPQMKPLESSRFPHS